MCVTSRTKAVTRNLFGGGSVSLVPVLLFLPLFPPFIPFPFYFLRLEVAPQIQLKAGKRQKFILGVIPSLPSISSLSSPPILPVSLSLRCLVVAPQIQLRDWLNAVSSSMGRTTLCSHQTRSLSSNYTRNTFVLLLCIYSTENVSGGCICRSPLEELTAFLNP